MIVVCTGCSAKFRVADEKVGPRGARLRCSKCQTVFTVQQAIEVPSAPPRALSPDPAPDSFVAGPLRANPPPLPRRATTLDARAAFDVDLEPHLGPAPAPADPFAPLPPEPPFEPGGPRADPFGPPSAPAFDPFGSSTAMGPPADPFGDPVAAPPPTPSPFDPATEPPDFDPFPPARPASEEPIDGPGAPPPPSSSAAASTGGFGSLSLEDATTPPARRMTRSLPAEPAPVPVMAASEDPFGPVTGFDPGLSVLDDGVLATAAPAVSSAPREPAPPRPEPDDEPPLQLDPFGAAAVAADPLAVGEPPRAAAAASPVETTAERQAADRSFRIRDVLVSAMALAALLLLSLAILVAWRGGLGPVDALRPAALFGALGPRPPAGVLLTRGVTSGLYERAHGAPLLFVRGSVVSTAPGPLEGVRVVVEVVRDGAVMLRGEAPAGAVPGLEALHEADDAAALARAAADAIPPGGARLAPGGTAPFLIAFAEYPADLWGASLRVRTVTGDAR